MDEINGFLEAELTETKKEIKTEVDGLGGFYTYRLSQFETTKQVIESLLRKQNKKGDSQ